GETPAEPIVEGPEKGRHLERIAQRRQELVLIAVEQGYVPGDGLAEALVDIALEPHGAAEEGLQIDAGLGGDQAQERRLILDRMGREIGDPDGFHRGAHRPTSSSKVEKRRQKLSTEK